MSGDNAVHGELGPPAAAKNAPTDLPTGNLMKAFSQL